MLSTESFPSKRWVWWAGSIGLATIIFFHVWQLTDLPRGLYVDESSIGYNAAQVAETLHDEHGARLPVYFKAFGEYKHPLYIYAAALLYRVFGNHEFMLRFTSFLFFAAFLWILAAFVHRLYRNTHVTMFIVLAAGFLPWFFPMSRIAFEVIAQVPILAGLLLCVYLAFHGSTRNRNWYAALAGVLIGLSIYTYSSSKLLAPLQLMSVGLFYARARTWQRFGFLTATALLVSLPAIHFSLANPGALSARFQTVTYLHDQSKTLADKASEFGQNYIRHFGLPFLIWTGDTNLRHATGHGGELFGIVATLAAAGIIYTLFQTKGYSRKFYLFLLFNLLVAPIPAAVTLGNTGHSLRTTLMGIVFLLFAGYGLQRLAYTMRAMNRRVFITTIFVILFVEAGLYVHHYFTQYPHASAVWFESYGFEQALDQALTRQPEHILVSSQGNAVYIQTKFYGQVLRGLEPSYITTGPPRALPNTCLIFFAGDRIHNPKSLAPEVAAQVLESRVRLHCYTRQ